MPKITVIGAGAIGGLIAGRLSASGQDVSILARGATLQTVSNNGLTIVHQDSNYSQTTYPKIFSSAEQIGIQDFVVLAVKSYSLKEVALLSRPMIGMHTQIIAAINGVPWWFSAGLHRKDLSLDDIDPTGVVRTAFPINQTIGCVVNLAASVPALGTVLHAKGNRLTLGSPTPVNGASAVEFCGLLKDAGFDASINPAIHQEVWKKLLGNITLNTIGTLTLADTATMLDDKTIVEFIVAIMNEVISLGTSLGINVGVTANERLDMAKRLGNFRSSMLQDLESGKPLEIDGLFGAVLTLARQTNTAVPFTKALYGLVKLRAQASGQYPQN
jgi:2-dehydropantoate 2-reductase